MSDPSSRPPGRDSLARRLRPAPSRPAGRARDIALRTHVVAGGFVVVFLALVARAAWLASGADPRLAERLKDQHEQVVTLHPMRGRILDREGRELAVSVRVPSVFADPGLFRDQDQVTEAAAKLAPILGMAQPELARKLSGTGRFVWLKRQISDAEARAVEALRLEPIRLADEARRSYPNGPLAGQVIGFTSGDGRGIEGLESRYDAFLRGHEERRVVLRDGRRRIVTPEGVQVREGTEGETLVLTLDRNIQFAAEQALAGAVQKWDCQGGMVLVMDVQTGGILAMATAPSFSPEHYRTSDASAYRNLPLWFNYEPGSVMKVFLVASALESGTVLPDTEFFCEYGQFTYGRKVIHDTHPYGDLTVRDVLKVSSNIGSAKIGDRMGREAMWEWYSAWGFGRTSGIDLPGESGGILRPWKKWWPVDVATHAFGQGVSVTALQIASGLSAIANGGRLMQPHVVAARRTREGRLAAAVEPVELRRVLCDRVATEVRGMMAGVMEEGGTGTLARLDDYTAAGKTGTAQKVNPATGRYEFWVSSFVGFAPLEDPRIAIVVTLDQPSGQHYGGVVAGPVFREVGRKALTTLGVPALPARQAALPVAPDAPALAASPVPGPGGQAPRHTDAAVEGRWVMPELKGTTVREALRALQGLTRPPVVEGTGLMVAQVPPAGTELDAASQVHLRFEVPPPPPRPPPVDLHGSPVVLPVSTHGALQRPPPAAPARALARELRR